MDEVKLGKCVVMESADLFQVADCLCN